MTAKNNYQLTGNNEQKNEVKLDALVTKAINKFAERIFSMLSEWFGKFINGNTSVGTGTPSNNEDGEAQEETKSDSQPGALLTQLLAQLVMPQLNMSMSQTSNRFAKKHHV
jgi:hypothetical protein